MVHKRLADWSFQLIVPVGPEEGVSVAVIVIVVAVAAPLMLKEVAIGTTTRVVPEVEGWKSLVPEKAAVTS